MKLSALGKIVREEWLRSAEIRKEIQVFEDEFMIMPNHLHGINWIVGADGVRPKMERAPAMRPNPIHPNTMPPKPQKPDARPHSGMLRDRASLRRVPRSLGSFIAGFKASVTSRAGRELNMTGIWQRNYYEHIVRNDRELHNIRWYIVNNPLNWQLDRDNLQNLRKLSPPENADEYLKDVDEMVLKLHNAA